MQNEARMAITTTLYDLISALQTQVDSDDDED